MFLTTQNMMETPLMVLLLSLFSNLATRIIHRLDRMLGMDKWIGGEYLTFEYFVNYV